MFSMDCGKLIRLNTAIMLVCFALLIGTTVAWFTDNVTSGRNRVEAGVLDVELYFQNADGSDPAAMNDAAWQNVETADRVIPEDRLYEPNYTSITFFKVVNGGDVALRYRLALLKQRETGSVNVNGQDFVLSDYMICKFVQVQPGQTLTREQAQTLAGAQTGFDSPHAAGALAAAGDTAYYALIVYMPASVGNSANARTDAADPQLVMDVKLIATQQALESDGFDAHYDDNASVDGWQ